MNLSDFKFTHNEFKLTNKDLIFCPTPHYFMQKDLEDDMKHFFRRIRLRAHFKNEKIFDEGKPKEEHIFTMRGNGHRQEHITL